MIVEIKIVADHKTNASFQRYGKERDYTEEMSAYVLKAA